MNAPYYDIATFLRDNIPAIKVAPGEWLEGVGAEDKQVLCLEGVGIPTDLKDLYQQPNIQILVRGGKRERDHDVYLVAQQVSDFLLSQSECVTINNTTYKGFEQSSTIAPLGKDENERFIYSMNFSTYRNSF